MNIVPSIHHRFNFIYTVHVVMKILEKSGNLEITFSRPGKVMENKKISERFGKVMGFLRMVLLFFKSTLAV